MVDDIAFVGIVATPFHAVEPKLEFTTDDFAVAVFFGNAEHATKLNRIADDQLRIRILTRIHIDQFFERRNAHARTEQAETLRFIVTRASPRFSTCAIDATILVVIEPVANFVGTWIDRWIAIVEVFGILFAKTTLIFITWIGGIVTIAIVIVAVIDFFFERANALNRRIQTRLDANATFEAVVVAHATKRALFFEIAIFDDTARSTGHKNDAQTGCQQNIFRQLHSTTSFAKPIQRQKFFRDTSRPERAI